MSQVSVTAELIWNSKTAEAQIKESVGRMTEALQNIPISLDLEPAYAKFAEFRATLLQSNIVIPVTLDTSSIRGAKFGGSGSAVGEANLGQAVSDLGAGATASANTAVFDLGAGATASANTAVFDLSMRKYGKYGQPKVGADVGDGDTASANTAVFDLGAGSANTAVFDLSMRNYRKYGQPKLGADVGAGATESANTEGFDLSMRNYGKYGQPELGVVVGAGDTASANTAVFDLGAGSANTAAFDLCIGADVGAGATASANTAANYYARSLMRRLIVYQLAIKGGGEVLGALAGDLNNDPNMAPSIDEQPPSFAKQREALYERYSGFGGLLNEAVDFSLPSVGGEKKQDESKLDEGAVIERHLDAAQKEVEVQRKRQEIENANESLINQTGSNLDRRTRQINEEYQNAILESNADAVYGDLKKKQAEEKKKVDTDEATRLDNIEKTSYGYQKLADEAKLGGNANLATYLEQMGETVKKFQEITREWGPHEGDSWWSNVGAPSLKVGEYKEVLDNIKEVGAAFNEEAMTDLDLVKSWYEGERDTPGSSEYDPLRNSDKTKRNEFIGAAKRRAQEAALADEEATDEAARRIADNDPNKDTFKRIADAKHAI